MPAKPYRVHDDLIVGFYQQTKSVWATGEILGIAGQTVHKRLRKYGLTARSPEFNPSQIERIKDYYLTVNPIEFDLDFLASELKKDKTNICRMAKRLGLSNRGRPLNSRQLQGVRQPKWQNKPHPRGMLGKRHTAATKVAISECGRNRTPEQRDRMSQASTNRWKLMTKEQKAALIEKQKVSWKGGWREIGGIRNFYRSTWEANYARYLEWLKLRGEIDSWEHEPETFWFEAIKRGCRSYLPDFRVVEKGKKSYHEVKGWMDPKSITKLKRMGKYYPDVRVILIQKKEYYAIAKIVSKMIPGWE